VLREQGPQCVHTIGAAEANEEFPKIRHRFQKPSVWEGALGGNFGDGTAVFVYGIQLTRWGMYVRVERASDCDVCGWVMISDVCSPNDWWQIPFVSRRR